MSRPPSELKKPKKLSEIEIAEIAYLIRNYHNRSWIIRYYIGCLHRMCPDTVTNWIGRIRSSKNLIKIRELTLTQKKKLTTRYNAFVKQYVMNLGRSQLETIDTIDVYQRLSLKYPS